MGIHNPKTRKLLTKTGCSHSGSVGFLDDPLCSYIPCAWLYLNSRHNAVTTRGKTSPTPQLQLRFDHIRRLPPKGQEFVVRLIHTVLEKLKKA